MPPAGGERSAVRKNQYNLHIRLDEDERAALEKGLQASGNNINQLARKANAGFASRDEVTRALRMLDRVYELMYQLSQQSWQ